MALFKLETRKDYNGYTWSNSWAVDADDFDMAVSAATMVASFEKQLLYNAASLDEVKVSTWPNPSGQGFRIVPGPGLGARAMSNPEPATMCLFGKLNAFIGHPGKKWLRMSLDESDVFQVAGVAVLNGSGGALAAFVAAAGDLDDDITALGATLVIGSAPASARNSTNLMTSPAVGFRDLDVGWYNKGP